MVKSAFLNLNIKFHSGGINTKITVAQRVEDDELIYLDILDVTTDDEDTLVKLDITHAVHAWVDDPDTNLGLRVIFDSAAPQLLSPPHLVVDSQHSFVRRKRSLSSFANLVDHVPRIPSDSDCPLHVRSSHQGKKKQRPHCCR